MDDEQEAQQGNIIEASAVCFPAALWKLLSIRGRSSTERFVHFNCGSCEKWFSIGDTPADRTKWTCPWCGTKQEYDPVLPEDMEETRAVRR